MKDHLKKHQKLESPGRRNEKLRKVAKSQSERSINRLGDGKQIGRDVRQAGIEKLVKHEHAINAIQTDQNTTEEVDAEQKRTRYASLREVSPNNSMGEVF